MPESRIQNPESRIENSTTRHQMHYYAHQMQTSPFTTTHLLSFTEANRDTKQLHNQNHTVLKYTRLCL